MPALNSAIEALSQLSKGDIVEVKAMKTPPGGVILVSKALCWAFNVKPKKVPAPDGRSKMDDYWEPAKKELWGDPKLLDKLLYFDKDNIPADVMVKLAPLETDPEFEPDAIKKASVAAFGICKWVRAMIVYDQVAKMVGPKKEALGQAQGELAEAEGSLAIKKAELKKVQDNVANLMSDFGIAKQKKDDLQNQYEVCSKRLVTAEKLINGLGGEKGRWLEAGRRVLQPDRRRPHFVRHHCLFGLLPGQVPERVHQLLDWSYASERRALIEHIRSALRHWRGCHHPPVGD